MTGASICRAAGTSCTSGVVPPTRNAKCAAKKMMTAVTAFREAEWSGTEGDSREVVTDCRSWRPTIGCSGTAFFSPFHRTYSDFTCTIRWVDCAPHVVNLQYRARARSGTMGDKLIVRYLK